MTDLDQHRIVVILFKMDGCPACAAFEPRFRQLATPYLGRFPILIADANDPGVAPLADRLGVNAVPATFVMRKPSGIIRAEGVLSDAELGWMLNVAAREAMYG